MSNEAPVAPEVPEEKLKKPFYKRWWFIALVVILALAIIGGMNGKSSDKKASETPTQAMQTENAKQRETEAKTEAPTEPTTEVVTQAPTEAVPVEFKNAVKSCQAYERFMPMSKQGMYDQLVSEYGDNFPPEAAQYAIENCGADWKENAAKSARQYQERMNMSRDAIYEQLISEYGEQFTEEEAQYGVDQLPQ